MMGEVHDKPCDYNCPCNTGKVTWVECADCPERRRPSPMEAAFTAFDATYMGGLGGGKFMAWRAFAAGWEARKAAQYAAIVQRPMRTQGMTTRSKI